MVFSMSTFYTDVLIKLLEEHNASRSTWHHKMVKT